MLPPRSNSTSTALFVLDRRRLGKRPLFRGGNPARRRLKSRHPSEGRELMPPVHPERQWLDPMRGGQRQLAVEMGKQRAAARRLPYERRSELLRRDRDEDEVARP